MSLQVKIQSKAENVLASEASFYGVTATALAKAIIDKVATGGILREVLQDVDVSSYQDRKRGTPRPKSIFDYKGEKLSLPAIARKSGIPLITLRNRIYARGWSADRAFSVPVKEKRK